MAEDLTYSPKFTVVDAFCGCGGLSLGLSMTRRFQPLLGFDISQAAVATFAENHELRGGMRPVVLTEDIRKLQIQSIRDLMPKEIRRSTNLDVLVGGPPCEGFSQNRTDRETGERTHKFIEDPRNELFRWFVSLSKELRPSVVVIENVPDLLRHRNGATRDEIIAALDEAGYVASARVLNAANYGVPQIRRRAFFLAQRKEDLQVSGMRLRFPHPTHRPYPLMHDSLNEDTDWLPGDSGYWLTVREAIGDLPAATPNDNYDHLEAQYPRAANTQFRAMMRAPTSVPYHHVARALGPGGLARVQAMAQGQMCADLPNELRPKSYYHYSYSRLSWAQPARTITKFVYHVGSGQFAHPIEDRAITMREALRLQSFPDTFRLFGTTNIREISSLIGSAVPPLLAAAIGREVSNYLDHLHLAKMDPTSRAGVRMLEGDAVVRRLEREQWGALTEAQLELLTKQ